ncbi:Ulp1 family isopeptidase, partial [Litorimonas sp.]|uniref:Ulp1 family isopeptidase n=1 Tax=Litorimonas sp. TaxID=1892381 RepID=UPI003A873700
IYLYNKIQTDDQTPAPAGNEVFCEFRQYIIRRSSYMSLRPAKYINDEIVDGYLQFNHSDKNNVVPVLWSFFYTQLINDQQAESRGENASENSPSLHQRRHQRVRSYIRRINLLDIDAVIIPICKQSHWYAVVATDLNTDQPKLFVLNSLSSCGKQQETAYDLKRFFEIELKKNVSVHIPEVPKQHNNVDCALFLMHNVELVTKDIPDFKVYYTT